MGIMGQFDLSGQCAIITGAGTNLGRQMALHLAEAGCDIVGVGRRAEPIEAVGEEIRAHGRRYLGVSGCDVTDSSAVSEMVSQAIVEMGQITVLINNAGGGGVGRGKTLPELTDEEWQQGVGGNLDTAFYCSRAIIPHMVEHQTGTVISIASGWGYRAGRNNWMYPVAKAGVISLTKALAATYASDNIRAVSIAPGFFPKIEEDEREQMLTGLGQRQPAGRVGFMHEIGPLAVFLVSPAAAYVSGETILLDGGSISAGLTPAGVAPRVEG